MSSAKHYWKLSVASWAILTSTLAIAGLFLFADGLAMMVSYWEDRKEYSHGYLIPIIALYLVWKSTATASIKQTAILLFVVQLTLNFFWSILFFQFQLTGWAFVEIIAMWVAILFTILWFGKISSTAAWLLVPYICWVSFASLLNYSIWKLN